MFEAEMTRKMIDFYVGSLHDIEHFFKVHAYAALIGRLEGLDEDLLETVELAAIVHDIACPLCRDKYGSAPGFLQEEESEELLIPFLAEFALPESKKERIIWLVCHHHTMTDISGADHQILLEADFLVNASEGRLPEAAVRSFYDNIARTQTGRQLFESIYLHK